MADLEHIQQLCRGVSAWNEHRRTSEFTPDLSHVEIRNAVLAGADLSDCDFDGARLTNVNLSNARLEGARLNGVKISRTSFRGAILSGIELKGADLTRVCLRGVRLEDAVGLDLKLRHSDLGDAVFANTQLRMSHFYNCDLSGTQFQRTQLDRSLAKRVTLSAEQITELEDMGCAVELANASRRDEWLDWDRFAIDRDEHEFGVILYQGRAYWIAEGRWDFFVSHSSADKDTVARPLAEALRERGQRVWFDEAAIRAADRLDAVIDFGIQSSVFGVVVVSPSFFGRRWTEQELAALERKRLFLVLHRMEAEDLARIRPALAERLALSSTAGPEQLADAILNAAHQPPRQTGLD